MVVGNEIDRLKPAADKLLQLYVRLIADWKCALPTHILSMQSILLKHVDLRDF